SVVVFHSGTAQHHDMIITNGGRVLGISATGTNLNLALEKGYSAINEIQFEGMAYRKDIGKTVSTRQYL
ncbi:MAG: phosphoribosylglycinamide synthetase C domain-containing protein, partial [Patescibacteria group bacterium]